MSLKCHLTLEMPNERLGHETRREKERKGVHPSIRPSAH